MAEAMYADMKADYKRIIAIGGGTIIDISKIFAPKMSARFWIFTTERLKSSKIKSWYSCPQPWDGQRSDESFYFRTQEPSYEAGFGP